MVESHRHPIIEEIIEITSQDPSQCYQCGKCSGGCPVREFAIDAPNRIVRYIQLGFFDKAMNSPTIWLCAGCMTCTSRCPKNFDLAAFMDAMREIAGRRGIVPSDKDSYKFHESFLNQIRNHGRSYEMGMLMEYKMKTGHLMQDMDVAPETILKGKIGFFPHNIKGKTEVKEIFRKTKEEKK